MLRELINCGPRVGLLMISLFISMPSRAQDLSNDVEIRELMSAFRVREVGELTVKQIVSDARFKQLPEPKQVCLTTVLNADIFYEEMFQQYKNIFSDPKLRREILSFIKLPAGKKMIDLLAAQILEANNFDKNHLVDVDALMKEFTDADIKALGEFRRTPAGEYLMKAPKQLADYREKRSPQIISEAFRECDISPKS
jgi:hypothetical protein